MDFHEIWHYMPTIKSLTRKFYFGAFPSNIVRVYDLIAFSFGHNYESLVLMKNGYVSESLPVQEYYPVNNFRLV